MAEIRPFRGIRYSDKKFPDFSAVISPPYDVISRADYSLLRARSDRNFVRLDLGDRFHDHAATQGTYTHAAELLDDWLGDETLIQDLVPAIYLMEQEFEAGGARLRRRSFIARVRIEVFGQGCIFPHEQTMPGPKADRLAHMCALRMNMSPIFGLYEDDGVVAAILAQMAEVDPVAAGTGIDGVRNTLRVIYHPGLIAALAEAFENKRVIIADGHHRYETAIAYRDERRLERAPPTYEEPHEFVAIALVSMSDPGLVIRPTHRLVAGIKSFVPTEFFQKAGGTYEVEEATADASFLIQRISGLAGRHAFAVVTAEGARILVRRDGLRGATGQLADLDTHILHHEILGEMLGLGPDTRKKGGPLRYVQSADECLAAIAAGQAQLAVLVNPTRMDEVAAIAVAGGVMPPKSTFFFPKMPAGIVVNPLI